MQKFVFASLVNDLLYKVASKQLKDFYTLNLIIHLLPKTYQSNFCKATGVIRSTNNRYASAEG